MGEVIRKNAAAADIYADAQTSLANAAARGEAWSKDAEEHLRPIAQVGADVESRLKAASLAYEPLRAALRTGDELADRLLGRISDEIWNEVGRPGSDAFLDLLLPGGVAYYADGDTEEQPGRMELLAELLESKLHPRLSAEKAAAFARQVREGASALRVAVENARAPRQREALLERVRTAVARSTQSKLAALKRIYKARGFSEAEIHRVIPDRSADPAKPTEAKPPEPPA